MYGLNSQQYVRNVKRNVSVILDHDQISVESKWLFFLSLKLLNSQLW